VRQGRFDGCDHFRRIGGGGGFKAGDGVAVAVEEEFGEVPLDFAAEFRIGGLVGEELIERRLVVAFYGELGHHGEADVVLLGAEGLDLRVGAGLLGHEVVGGHSDDDQPPIFVFLVEGFESGVLRGESAAAGYVDQEQDFAVEIGEPGGLAVDGFEGEVVDGAGRGGLSWLDDGGGEGRCEAQRQGEQGDFAHVSSKSAGFAGSVPIGR